MAPLLDIPNAHGSVSGAAAHSSLEIRKQQTKSKQNLCRRGPASDPSGKPGRSAAASVSPDSAPKRCALAEKARLIRRRHGQTQKKAIKGRLFFHLYRITPVQANVYRLKSAIFHLQYTDGKPP